MIIMMGLLLTGCGKETLTTDTVTKYMETTEYEHYQVIDEDLIVFIDITTDWEDEEFRNNVHSSIRSLLAGLSSMEIDESSPQQLSISISTERGGCIMVDLSTTSLNSIDWGKITDKNELDRYVNTNYINF